MGALLGDAVIHLIPEALGVHDHGSEEEGGSESDLDFVGPSCVILLGVLVFFIIERQISHLHSHRYNNCPSIQTQSIYLPIYQSLFIVINCYILPVLCDLVLVLTLTLTIHILQTRWI